MKDTSSLWLPGLLMAAFAVTRWPGLLPQNFSAAYALVFCAGVFFPRAMRWWLPLATMVTTDLLLNWHYRQMYEANPDAYAAPMEFFNPYLLANYLSYGLLIALGARLKPAAHWLKLVAGGVLGALIFYLISNTAAWLQLAAYSKTFAGWLQALTVGLPGYPPTWSFLLKTLMSGGLFTGLFVGAMRATQASESAREKEAVEPSPSEEPAEADPKPQEAGS